MLGRGCWGDSWTLPSDTRSCGVAKMNPQIPHCNEERRLGRCLFLGPLEGLRLPGCQDAGEGPVVRAEAAKVLEGSRGASFTASDLAAIACT